MNPTLQEIIEPLLNNEYKAKDITPAHKIRDILEDSLSCTELLLEIEYKIGISIPDPDFQKMKTIGDLEAYIQRHEPKQKCA